MIETNENGLRRMAALLESGSYDERCLLRSADELATLRVERDRLREALIPFTEAFSERMLHRTDADIIRDGCIIGSVFTVGEFRQALIALAAQPGEK